MQIASTILPPAQAFIALRKGLDMTQTEAAAAIAKRSMRPCALRTVQAWEAKADHKSARPCPPWAVTILQTLMHEAQNNNPRP